MKYLYSFRGKQVAIAIMLMCAAIRTNAQTLNAHANTAVTTNCNGYYDYLPAGYNPSGTQTYPVLIAFGGLSQNGDGSTAQLDYVFSNWGGPGWQIINGKFPSSITVNGTLFRFIVILPQFTSNPGPKGVDGLINYILAHYKADASRIYLTGNSAGGGYCWDYPGYSVQYAQRIAAVVPTCAAASYTSTKANNIAAANLPVWATHNAIDPTVSPNTTKSFVNGINAAPVPPTPRAKMTIFQDQGHNCADSTFNMTYGVGAYAWMLGYKRGSAPANQPPIANAGSDKAITLPTSSVQLNGSSSYDPDGTITYSWSKIAGPAQSTLSSTTIVNPILSNLVAGTYTFRLTVTDNSGAKATDDINIVVNAALVNQPPVANAGADVSLTLPANSLTLDGSKSNDPDGTITYSWTKIAGPSQYTLSSTTAVKPLLSNLTAGTYTFRLTVTDNAGAKSSDDINIIVVSTSAVNVPPVADAGPDVILYLPSNTVTLTGKGTDVDGTIAAYAWKQMSGPNTSTISTPAKAQTSVGNLIAGRYVYKLTVTDNKGATAWNQMQLTVKGGVTKSVNVSIYGGSNPYNNSAWNNWNVGNGSNSSLTSPALKYSDGTASNIKGVLSYTLTMADNGSTYPGGMAPPEVLRYSSYSKTARTLTLTGLSTSLKYTIELYASRLTTTFTTQFAVNSSSVNIATYQNYTNKAVFTNLTPNAQGQIVVNIGTVTGYNYLNGFAIMEQGATAGVMANNGSVSEANDEVSPTDVRTSLKVYPNPVSDKFVLQLNSLQQQGTLKIQLYNINGAVIKEMSVTNASRGTVITMPVHELAPGTYLLKIQAGLWSETRKVVKL